MPSSGTRFLTVTALALTAMVVGCQAPGRQSPTATPAGVDHFAARDRAIECLKRAVQYRQNPALRVAAIEAFASSLTAEGQPWIRAAMLDEHPGVRFAACMAIGTMRDETAMVGVRELTNDPDANVRVAALFALHRLGDTSGTGRMAVYLLEDEDPLVRRNAAFALGRLEEPGAIKLLARAMKDKDQLVLDHALEAMARLGSDEARQQLVCVANSGIGSDEVFAITALGATRDRRYEDLYRMKLEADESPHMEIRLAAARSLGHLGHFDGYQLAMQSLRFSKPQVVDSEDSAESKILRTRMMAASALGAIGNPDAVPTLLSMIGEGEDARYQVSAAQAVLEIVLRSRGAELGFPVAKRPAP